MLSSLKSIVREYKDAQNDEKTLKFIELVCELIATKQLLDKRDPMDGRTWLVMGRIYDLLWSAGFTTKLNPAQIKIIMEDGAGINMDVVKDIIDVMGNIQTMDPEQYLE
jgi:hypothetical protein